MSHLREIIMIFIDSLYFFSIQDYYFILIHELEILYYNKMIIIYMNLFLVSIQATIIEHGPYNFVRQWI